jgi:hypothetical protein
MSRSRDNVESRFTFRIARTKTELFWADDQGFGMFDLLMGFP